MIRFNKMFLMKHKIVLVQLPLPNDEKWELCKFYILPNGEFKQEEAKVFHCTMVALK